MCIDNGKLIYTLQSDIGWSQFDYLYLMNDNKLRVYENLDHHNSKLYWIHVYLSEQFFIPSTQVEPIIFDDINQAIDYLLRYNTSNINLKNEIYQIYMNNI